MITKRIIGEVVRYSDFRGFGFIRYGKNPAIDYFVHVSSIHSADIKTLDAGQTVEFTPRQGRKGPQAIDVRVISSEKSHSTNINFQPVCMKRNPFTPQDPITNPEKFAGRREAIHNAVDAIYNNKNLLITGARGIGKSSISYQLLYLARGEMELIKKFGIDLQEETFDHICGDHRCLPGNCLFDIANSLVATLLLDIGKKDIMKERTETIEFDLKYFKAGSKETFEKLSPSDISVRFVADVDTIFRSVDHWARGITFLIDEVDVLLDEIDLAPFLKATSEKLRLNNHLNVSFIVCGVTGTATDLIRQAKGDVAAVRPGKVV